MGVRMKNRHDRDTANRSPDRNLVAPEGVQGNPLELVAGVRPALGAIGLASYGGFHNQHGVRTA